MPTETKPAATGTVTVSASEHAEMQRKLADMEAKIAASDAREAEAARSSILSAAQAFVQPHFKRAAIPLKAAGRAIAVLAQCGLDDAGITSHRVVLNEKSEPVIVASVGGAPARGQVLREFIELLPKSTLVEEHVASDVVLIDNDKGGKADTQADEEAAWEAESREYFEKVNGQSKKVKA